MSEKTIPVIDLVDEDGNNVLFGTDSTRYVVPVYQRAFAWGSDNSGKKQNEIIQLMDDVLAAKGTYYLGSLVVSKCPNGEYDFEVIDGQQRLTALYIIFAQSRQISSSYSPLLDRNVWSPHPCIRMITRR